MSCPPLPLLLRPPPNRLIVAFRLPPPTPSSHPHARTHALMPRKAKPTHEQGWGRRRAGCKVSERMSRVRVRLRHTLSLLAYQGEGEDVTRMRVGLLQAWVRLLQEGPFGNRVPGEGADGENLGVRVSGFGFRVEGGCNSGENFTGEGEDEGGRTWARGRMWNVTGEGEDATRVRVHQVRVRRLLCGDETVRGSGEI